ncbi:hypothetical protein RND71_015719 [Anisodus tanguticus]|uniref:Uncharacterized protein n=1 Tax=Anisodus tanguticus TaxID=243964 RepID=A0AAE1VHY7_9SOLA|nr:hypothetical protein RND71_015719 [Anisodus tanguticus]
MDSQAPEIQFLKVDLDRRESQYDEDHPTMKVELVKDKKILGDSLVQDQQYRLAGARNTTTNTRHLIAEGRCVNPDWRHDKLQAQRDKALADLEAHAKELEFETRQNLQHSTRLNSVISEGKEYETGEGDEAEADKDSVPALSIPTPRFTVGPTEGDLAP